MKIEKVNDHQIRCTLTKADLADRELKISELAYGTEKAKNLFRDMMQQASFEFGFEAEDIPLMIEAIPLNSECIVLIITKVEDPEELDTRFSKFAPSVHDTDYSDEDTEIIDGLSEGADDVLDLFKRIHEDKFTDISDEALQDKSTASGSSRANMLPVRPAELSDFTKIYSLDSINAVTRLARVLKNYYHGVNSLYKNNNKGIYILTVSKSDHTPEEYNKICNIISEYAASEKYAGATHAYLEEHCEIVLRDNAIQSLALI
ncbi:MAG: adaptor protein MecA [Lachnospiraceae bacterium]|nr:adaptor protein MecA [Lachnospiraceae bacterium]